MAEKFSKLHLAAFTIETLAHTQGLEVSLLPQAEFVRKVDELMKRFMEQGPTSGNLRDLGYLCRDNEK